ncbi:MAG TPA: hypothetical protein VGV12_08575 [Gemmatimonadales bacterium]|nr:hypothetical protein [Gemmatimonadales bacterium]
MAQRPVYAVPVSPISTAPGSFKRVLGGTFIAVGAIRRLLR